MQMYGISVVLKFHGVKGGKQRKMLTKTPWGDDSE